MTLKQRKKAQKAATADSKPVKVATPVEKKLSAPWFDSRRVVFVFGALLGLLVAVYFGANKHPQSEQFFDSLLSMEGISDYMDDWKDLIPFELPSFADFKFEDITGFKQAQDLTSSFAVGKQMHSEYDLQAKHQVVMVPGVVSTGLESWGLYGDDECSSEHHFRKRLWGSFYMLKSMVMEKTCWLKHIMLDPETGLDPPNFKLRAAQGFEAADFFMAGYWIWNKILQNLAAIGYEPNKMVVAAYDWRLAYLDLEVRDSYFTKLKHQIEVHLEETGEKTVLIGHSMGSQVSFYFLKWVEAEGPKYGNGGPNWVNTHIDSFVDIAGSMLGAPKAVPALISGEMKDTIQLNSIAMYGLEKFFSRRERLDMLRTFGGIASMLPKGGDLLWGDLTQSMEDSLHNNTDTFGNFIRFETCNGTEGGKNYTLEDSIQYIKDRSPTWLQKRIEEQYSYGVAQTEEELLANNHDHTKWSNPMEAALPNAPDLKVFCFYGVGNPTERAYVYKEEEDKEFTRLNISISYESNNPVFFTDGDGTLPIITHMMCHKWKTSQHYNPANVPVKIVEIKHEPNRFDIRGGAKSAEHVDILGNGELNELVLKVASHRPDLIKEKFISSLNDWSKKLKLPLD